MPENGTVGQATESRRTRVWPSIVLLAVSLPAVGFVANTATSVAVGRSLGPSQEVTPAAVGAWMMEQFPTPAGFISIVGPIQLTLLALAFVAAAISPDKTFKRLGFVRGRLPLRTLPLLMLAWVVTRAIGTLLVSLRFSGPSEQALAMRKAFIELSGWSAVVVVICGAILPSLCEESVFRGFVLRGLLRRINPWLAIGIVSLVFAAIHPGLYIAVLVFPAGVWFGIVAWRTGPIWPAIAVHLFGNLAGSCLERAAPDPTKLHFLQPSLLNGVVLLVGIVAFVASIRILVRLKP